MRVPLLIILNILSIVKKLSVLLSHQEVTHMISYQPFYNTLFENGTTEYQLIHIHGISANTLYRMKQGESITTKTIDRLCYILDCEVEDIIYHDKSVAEE